MPADPRVPASTGADAGRRLAGVIFDMDGVIVDSEPLSMRTLAAIAAERGVHLEPALLHELTGVSLEEVLRVVAARLAAGPARLTAPAADGTDPAQLRRDYDERYLPQLRAAVPTPGLERLVTGLADRAFRWPSPHRPRWPRSTPWSASWACAASCGAPRRVRR
jgi:beta-phosphoglucomutase-like phosphatase (HAD superfamily)